METRPARSSLPAGQQHCPVTADLAEPQPRVSASSLAPPCCHLGQSDIPSPAPGTSPLLRTAPSSSVVLVFPHPGRPRVPWSPGEGSGCRCPQPGQSCTGPGLQLVGPALRPILSSLLSPSLLGQRPKLGCLQLWVHLAGGRWDPRYCSLWAHNADFEPNLRPSRWSMGGEWGNWELGQAA